MASVATTRRTALVAAGLGFGLVQLEPGLATSIGNFITTTVPQYFESQPAPGGNTAPVSVTVLQSYKATISIEVTSGADDAAVREAFRQKFVEQAQQDHPGATLSSNAPLSYIGSPVKTDLGNGFAKWEVEMSGFLNVPQQ